MSDEEKIKELEEKIKEFEKTNENYLNNWKRAQADLINYKKEIEKEKSEWIKFANLILVLELLPILDNFNKALTNQEIINNQGASLWLEGIKNIKKQFEALLKKVNVEEIKISPQEKFNPEFHEAVSKEKIEGKEKETILKELEKGYKFFEKTIRPAKVVISD